MIQATFNVNDKGEIDSFKIKGHAGYAPSGRDIVCAAVSALVIGTINGVQVLTDAALDVVVSNGITKADIKSSTSSSNVLLRSMVLTLESIQEEYPNNLELTVLESS